MALSSASSLWYLVWKKRTKMQHTRVCSPAKTMLETKKWEYKNKKNLNVIYFKKILMKGFFKKYI